jgi:hypothetical protein
LPASIAIASGLIFIGGAVLTIRRDGFRSLWRLTIKAETLFYLVLLFGFSYLFNHVLPLFDDFATFPLSRYLPPGKFPSIFHSIHPYPTHTIISCCFLLDKLFASAIFRRGWR